MFTEPIQANPDIQAVSGLSCLSGVQLARFNLSSLSQFLRKIPLKPVKATAISSNSSDFGLFVGGLVSLRAFAGSKRASVFITLEAFDAFQDESSRCLPWWRCGCFKSFFSRSHLPVWYLDLEQELYQLPLNHRRAA